MKATVVHDYFVVQGGAERVATEMALAFPNAPIFTSAAVPDAIPAAIQSRDIRQSYLRRAPCIARGYRAYFALYGGAMRRLRLEAFDLVLASSSAWAHHVMTDGVLVVYCHTPPRFLWEPESYLRFERTAVKLAASSVVRVMLHRLRQADLDAAARVDLYIANSAATAEKIRRVYGRESIVIHPPVDVRKFAPRPQASFALVVARLQPYKNIQLAMDAAQKLNLPLCVVGEGPARRQLESRNNGKAVFLGRTSDEAVRKLMGEARVLISPAKEDFGLVHVEANASGCPVVAYAGGGAREVVADGVTGVLFTEPTVESLQAAIETALTTRWDRRLLVRHARQFDRVHFHERLTAACESALGSGVTALASAPRSGASVAQIK